MVNRKAAIIASSVVAVLIAAGVVLAVIFTVVLPNKTEGPEVSSFAAPNPGMKLMTSSGNVSTNNWLMTYRSGVDVEAVRREMENANMPWNITAVDAANNQVMMQCEPNMVSAAAAMKTNALLGAYVEQDVVWRINAPTTVWGLDRTDQRNLPLNGDYSPGGYDGSTVDVHVLDTGVDANHPDIIGRVQPGYDGVQDGRATTTDCQGHGTHVSGTIGGTTYGLAKGTTIYASRVLGCSGSGSTLGIGNAIEWVANLPAGKKRVINMSLGGGASQYLDQKVAYAVSKGVTVVVAAGNENQNACNVSPAREPTAITVAASDRSDVKASFSNWGPCTDIVAPGVAIASARPTELGGGATGMSGTSMASPHVAGVAALVLQAYPDYSPAQVADHLINTAVPNVVQGLTGNAAQTPNRLLFWSAPAPATSTSTSTSTSEPLPTTVPTSVPVPETSAPLPGDVTETGNLPVGGVIQFPIGGYLTVTKAGPITANLIGAPGTDFDLYLWRYVNGQWAMAERAETPSSTESMTYNNVDATTQYFIFQIASFTGEGPFALSYTDPQA